MAKSAKMDELPSEGRYLVEVNYATFLVLAWNCTVMST